MIEIPIYICSLPEAKIMADLEGVNNDLRLVFDILVRLPTVQNDSLLADALFSAGLITYRRCFASGVRNGLTRDDIVCLPGNAIELHDYLYAQANKLIAHSVNPFQDTKIGICVAEDRIVGIATLNSRLRGFDEFGIHQWGSLVKLIGNTVLNPRIDEAREAVRREAEALQISEITKARLLGYTVPGPEAAHKARD